MTTHDDSVDVEMDRLLTPGGHLSRFEQDVIAANILHATTEEHVAAASTISKHGSGWSTWMPAGFAGLLSTALVGILWVGEVPPGPSEFASKGSTLLQVRCNQEAAVFFPAGEHAFPRCTGQLEIRFVYPLPVFSNIAVVSHDDDLRWVEPIPGATPVATRNRSFAIRARGNEQMLLVKNVREEVPAKAILLGWEAELTRWKQRLSPTDMRIVFESPKPLPVGAP